MFTINLIKSDLLLDKLTALWLLTMFFLRNNDLNLTNLLDLFFLGTLILNKLIKIKFNKKMLDVQKI